MSDFKVIVSGAGPAGLAAAILLAMDGVKTAVVAPSSQLSDPRTVALMQPSMQFLKFAGLWTPEIESVSAPLKLLQIVDDTGNYVTAPDVTFSASEAKLDAFGWNVPLATLTPSMLKRAEALGVTIIDDKSESSKLQEHSTILRTAKSQTLSAEVIIAADGGESPIRKSRDIKMESWHFDQSALVTTFSHTGSHSFMSTEYHKGAGAFTTVPLPGNRSSLVWMEKPAKSQALYELSDAELAVEIQIETKGNLGRISDIGTRKLFPMRGERAAVFAKDRVILLGEAAHTQPPLGAQGLNMSFRDAAQAADLIIGAEDAGAATILKEYDRLRRVDVIPRQQMISMVNMSLLSEFAAFGLLRAAGLAAVAKIPPLRSLAMAQGLAPSSNLPFAMRG
jgi:2-octaprenyl-6-methoxyphenol hydroxylase